MLLHACTVGLRSEPQEKLTKQLDPLQYNWEAIDNVSPDQAHIHITEHFEAKGIQNLPQTATAAWLLKCLRPFKLSPSNDYDFLSPMDRADFEYYSGLLTFLIHQFDGEEVSSTIKKMADFLHTSFPDSSPLILLINERNIDRFLDTYSKMNTLAAFVVSFLKKDEFSINDVSTVVSREVFDAEDHFGGDEEVHALNLQQEMNVPPIEATVQKSYTVAFRKKENDYVYFDPFLARYVSCSLQELKSLLLYHVLTEGYYSELMSVNPITKDVMCSTDIESLHGLNTVYFNDFTYEYFAQQSLEHLEKTLIYTSEQETVYEEKIWKILNQIMAMIPSFFSLGVLDYGQLSALSKKMVAMVDGLVSASDTEEDASATQWKEAFLENIRHLKRDPLSILAVSYLDDYDQHRTTREDMAILKNLDRYFNDELNVQEITTLHNKVQEKVRKHTRIRQENT